MSYSLTAAPAGMSINASTGVISWMPPEAISNYTANVTVRVSDGSLTSDQSYVITVSADNDAPFFTSVDATFAVENVPYSYDVEAEDPEGQPLTFSLTTFPAGMTINAATGVISWTPPTAAPDADVTVQVSDGTNNVSHSFVILVSDVNTPPVFDTTPVTTATEGVAYVYNVDGTDPDGATLSYSLTVAPAGMSINAASGLINWLPPQALADYAVNVTVRISDGITSATQPFVISVSADNDAPVFSSSAVTTGSEGVAYSYTATATDPEGQPLSFSLTSAPAGMSINATSGVISWLPPEALADYSANVTVRVSDGVLAATQDFTVNVSADNDAPVFSSSPVTTASESVAYSYTATASDPESQALVFALDLAPAGMSINASTGVIDWTPPEATNGYSVNVIVRVNDGAQDGFQSFSITVAADNDAPVFSSSAVTTASEGVAYSYTAMATDPESQSISYSLTTAPTGMTINSATGEINWTPPEATADYSENVVVRASDGVQAATQAFAIAVSADNDLPVFGSVPVTTASEGVAYSYTAAATDPESQPLTYSLTVAPAGMTINSTTGIVSWTPPQALADFTANVTVRVSDGGVTADQSFVISVTAVDEAPTFTSTAVTVASEGVAYSYTATATDPESQPLTYTLDTAPAGMSINASTGVISWTPPQALADFTANVTVRVSDGLHDATQAFVINVSASNDAPLFTSTAITVAGESVAYGYTATATDPEGQPLTFSLTAAPAGMTIDGSTGVIAWLPPQAVVDYTANVTVQVSDGLLTRTQSFVITVSASNDLPVFSSVPVIVASEGVAYSYTATATDPEGQTLSFSLTTAPAGMSINATSGVISWTPPEALA
ncbi:MAG: putative Ig domain-containing protein, partial [Moraxellaceae bacterium]|nr:putative Ig domain-containing protein [Moraxellaceae bacterium]